MSKSNTVQVLFRFWVVAFIFALFPFGIFAVIAKILSFSFLAFAALVATLLFNFIQWLGHRAIFGGTEEYKELKAKGLDPWFDVSCPWPFRPEDDEMATHQEPESRFYCNNCGTEALDLDLPCRVCGFEQYECGICSSPVKDQFAACPRCGNDPLG